MIKMVQISLKQYEMELIVFCLGNTATKDSIFAKKYLEIIQKFRRKTAGKTKKFIIDEEIRFADKTNLKAFLPIKYRKGVKK